MSQENVEALLAAVDAVNRQDPDAFVAYASPDIEWEDSVFWSETPRTFQGREQLRDWFREVIVEPWGSLHCEVTEITEAVDDRVFYGLLLTATGKGSGAETRLRLWAVNWYSNGTITRRRVFLHRDEALEVSGLRE